MGLTGTTTFTPSGSNQKQWYKVWYTGGSTSWTAHTTGAIYGYYPNFLDKRLTNTGSDTLTVYFQYAVFKVTTDSAGCSGLSFAFNSSSVTGCSFAKTTSDVTSSSNFPTSWSSMTKSGATYSVSNVAMLPNTTYYLWIRSDDSTNGHNAGSSVTITGSGTYGSPGNITANNTNFDSPINMSYGSSTSGGTYTVKVKVGTSSEVTLQTQSSTSSRSWTPALSTYGSSYPNQSSVSCVITVSTYFGGVLSGTKTKTVTISFTAAQVGPSASSAFSIAPYNTGAVSGMTGYIQGYSKIRASFNASNVTTQYGATIAKWSVKFGSAAAVEVAAGTTTKDSGVISAVTTVTCTVTDSRGFTASETYETTITPYENPALTATIKRTDSNGDEDDAGTYLRIDLAGWYSDIDGQNTQTSVVRRKLASASSYDSDIAITTGSTTLNDTRKLYSVANFLVSGMTDAVYNVQVEITDALGNKATATAVVESQHWAIHFRNKGTGAAFGKAAERDNELDIGNWKLTCGDVVVDSLSVVDSYGSNTNGNYCKLANGTLIQWGTMTVTSGSFSAVVSPIYYYSITHDLPMAFTGASYTVSGASRFSTGHSVAIGGYPSSASKVIIHCFDYYSRSMSASAALVVRWMAIGKWK